MYAVFKGPPVRERRTEKAVVATTLHDAAEQFKFFLNTMLVQVAGRPNMFVEKVTKIKKRVSN